jgi:hypothetical protein
MKSNINKSFELLCGVTHSCCSLLKKHPLHVLLQQALQNQELFTLLRGKHAYITLLKNTNPSF